MTPIHSTPHLLLDTGAGHPYVAVTEVTGDDLNRVVGELFSKSCT